MTSTFTVFMPTLQSEFLIAQRLRISPLTFFTRHLRILESSSGAELHSSRGSTESHRMHFQTNVNVVCERCVLSQRLTKPRWRLMSKQSNAGRCYSKRSKLFQRIRNT